MFIVENLGSIVRFWFEIVWVKYKNYLTKLNVPYYTAV